MADNRLGTKNPFDDDNGYGDVPARGAVGLRAFRGRGPDEFVGGATDDMRGGRREDAGFTPRYGHDSGYGGLGYTDRDDERHPSSRSDQRRSGGPHRGRGPKGYRRSDDRIREEVCERLTQDPLIDASEMEVEVRDREVTLSGSVASRGLRRRAEDIVEIVSGIAHVQNNLRVRAHPSPADV